MIAERQVTILNVLGLHVRPATHFAETAAKYRSRIWVIKESGPEINAKSSIDLLMLAAVAGTKITVRAEGDDAQEAVDVLVRMIESKFDEE
jgi:phosphocarrier protein